MGNSRTEQRTDGHNKDRDREAARKSERSGGGRMDRHSGEFQALLSKASAWIWRFLLKE
jgi:hypothetical protein